MFYSVMKKKALKRQRCKIEEQLPALAREEDVYPTFQEIAKINGWIKTRKMEKEFTYLKKGTL